MLSTEELYEGFPKGKAYRAEAIEKYGVQTIEESENKLRQLGKAGFEQLKADAKDITEKLLALHHQNPTSPAVQQQIARHYLNIRGFWGESVCAGKNMVEAYKGLAQLYVDDLRYTSQNGLANPQYAAFLNKAMVYFAETQIKEYF